MFVGGSCGSAVAGAIRYIQHRNLGADAVVVVLPAADSGSRYLSKVYDDDWLREASIPTGRTARTAWPTSWPSSGRAPCIP